jgi:hypothetical protein
VKTAFIASALLVASGVARAEDWVVMPEPTIPGVPKYKGGSITDADSASIEVLGSGMRCKLRQDVATDLKAPRLRIRKATQSHASESPSSSEVRSPNGSTRRRTRSTPSSRIVQRCAVSGWLPSPCPYRFDSRGRCSSSVF